MKGEADVTGGKGPHQKLTLGSDIKHAALLSHRHGETGQD